MRSPIDANVLLQEVISVLKQHILPSVSPDNKYNLLMSINALEITSRSLGENKSDSDSNDEMLSMISHAIQSGDYDDSQSESYKQLLEKLTQVNKQDLSVSNPKFIKDTVIK